MVWDKYIYHKNQITTKSTSHSVLQKVYQDFMLTYIQCLFGIIRDNCKVFLLKGGSALLLHNAVIALFKNSMLSKIMLP